MLVKLTPDARARAMFAMTEPIGALYALPWAAARNIASTSARSRMGVDIGEQLT